MHGLALRPLGELIADVSFSFLCGKRFSSNLMLGDV
jgi:hypothetical protein